MVSYNLLNQKCVRNLWEYLSATDIEVMQNEIARIDLVEGKLELKDQLRDYKFRGDALQSTNFLDYFLNTYEGEMVEMNDNQDNNQNQRGSRSSERIPYKPAAGKPRNLCRIIRRKGHETLPLFVGPWFPRNNDPSVRELYCASMLLLLKPWQGMEDLKSNDQTFHQSFMGFVATADDLTKDMIENIQYYHECSEGARKRREEACRGATVEIGQPVDELDEHVEDLDTPTAACPNIITDADISLARQSSLSSKEILFQQSAMDVAYNAGIFPEYRPYSSFLCPPRTAAFEDILIYQKWNTQLVTATRDDRIAPQNTIHHPTVLNVERPADSAMNTEAVIAVSDPVHLSYDGSRESLKLLNEAQLRVHNIVENHLVEHLAGRQPPQLLMLVMGQGGTGKSLLIGAITETFKAHRAAKLLAKTATSGVAASLIGGQTLHRWAGIPINVPKREDWLASSAQRTMAKRIKNLRDIEVAIVDECSMMTKSVLCCTSEIASQVRGGEKKGDPTRPFGGMSVILFGDFHQFPPVGNPSGALYCHLPSSDSPRAQIGRELFEQFTSVVMLREQKRIRDETWGGILGRLRTGDCEADDIRQIRRLVLTNSECDVPDFRTEPWSSAILVTSRHSVKTQWNSAALAKHSSKTGHRIFVSQAEDTGKDGLPIGNDKRLISVAMDIKYTGRLAERVELAIGMRAMVIINIATEADLANGTRGVIVDIKLDPREVYSEPDEDGLTWLQYPPAVVLFKPDVCPVETFEGLPPGIIPISPTATTFQIKTNDGKHTIHRRQLALIAAYAFTDFKSQGQTIEYVIVDLAKPPKGADLTPFNAYVALSRSRGRETIRLLREPDDKLFTTHPSEFLRGEDERLERLDERTRRLYVEAQGQWIHNVTRGS